MTPAEQLRLFIRELGKIEDGLRALCSRVDFKTQHSISRSILEAQDLRDCLLSVDKDLEADAYGGRSIGRNKD